MESKKHTLEIRQYFQRYKNKKILLYGSGKIAERMICALDDFLVVGILDRFRTSGTFMGKKIFSWDDVNSETADVVIISALPCNHEVIYHRIKDNCFRHHLVLLSAVGEDLLAYWGNDINRLELNEACNINSDAIKKLIDKHDAISFDVFDTLITRTVLEPHDVFRIVENRISQKGMVFNFFESRLEAERISSGGNIYQIYEVLQKNLQLTDSQRDFVLQQEIECEKEVLIPRDSVVELLNYSYDTGKHISLISDMYLPRAILESILFELGIKKFHQLYVSCDYSTFKSENLYTIYLDSVQGCSCFHIGNDSCSDGIMPRKHGIEAYCIKSGLDFLNLSQLRPVISYVQGQNDRNLLGILVSRIYNSPFSMNHTCGALIVKRYEEIGRIYFAPMVVLYMMELLRYLREHNGYDAVLFAARDGYLFYRLYEFIRQSWQEAAWMPRAVYFHSSRKSALRASMQHEAIISLMKENYLPIVTAEHLLEYSMGLNNIYPRKDGENDTDYINRHRKGIQEKAEKSRSGFLTYMKNIGIDKEKNYLFCELVSCGTTHLGLSYLFDGNLDGFYYCRNHYANHKFCLPVHAICEEYPQRPWHNAIFKDYSFLEAFLTAPHPSVNDMDSKGNPIFEDEKRSKEEILALNHAQNEIEQIFRLYFKMSSLQCECSSSLPEFMYRQFRKSKFVDECQNLSGRCMHDSWTGYSHDIWSNRIVRKM